MVQLCTVVADPCQLFREGISRLLEQYQIRTTASAGTLTEALDSIEPLDPPQIAIWGFDRGTDTKDRFAELQRARITVPGLRTVVLAEAPDRTLLFWAAASGIDAVLSKDISGEVLRRSLELVMLGQQLFPATACCAGDSKTAYAGPASAAPTVQDASPFLPAPLRRLGRGDSGTLLSDREEQTLQCLVVGAPNKLIARELGITEGTVKVHIKSLLRKLGAANRTQAAIWGIDHGLLLRDDRIVTAPSEANLTPKVVKFLNNGGGSPRPSIAM